MRRRTRARVISIVLFLVVLIVAVGMGAMVMISGTLNKIERVSPAPVQYIAPEEEVFEETTSEPDTIKAESVTFNTDGISLMRSDDVKNILLIGQDAREGEERQRSDSMIICSINTHLNKIVLVSLMRDMYVPIVGYSDNRINAAYMFGGMGLLDEVIEDDFGIHIDGNVEVDFEGFLEAFAVIGDLEIELKQEEADYLNQYGIWLDQKTDNFGWDLKAGKNVMDPDQVLAYARIRHVGNSDWERTERQRNVLTKAFQKAQNSDLSTLIKLANQVFPCLTTDLTISEILTFVKTVYSNGIDNLESYRLPVEDTYSSETIRGMSVLVPDLYQNSVYLQHYVYGTDLNEAAVKQQGQQGKQVARDEAPAEEAAPAVTQQQDYYTYTAPVADQGTSYIPDGGTGYVPDPGIPDGGGEIPAGTGGETPADGGEAPVDGGGEVPVDGGGGEAPVDGGGEVPVDGGGGEVPVDMGGGEVPVDMGGGEVPVDMGGGEVVAGE